MKIGIIGLPNSGKTTVFNALTGGTAETAAYSSGQLEPNLATVKVPDERLNKLSEMYKPKKITFADVQYIDVAGLSGDRKGGGLPAAFLNYIAQVDALLHVVRAFEDATVPHPEESVNPARDIETVDLELMFSDMAIIERRLQRIEPEIKKMTGKEKELRVQERDVLTRLQAGLEQNTPIRDQGLSVDEEKLLRGFQFLSAKPLLIVLNVGEAQLNQDVASTIEYQHQKAAVTQLAGKVEAEIAQLDEADAELFLADLNISEPARFRVIEQSYNLLGLISFLTAGPDEVRAWPLRQNTPAVEAAGEIHSDIQRGFIRAEIVAFDDLMAAGSMTEAKKRGTVRMEGKTYIIKDGDICNYLFNV
ncbi:MAG: redox-regulated ATPase YchF [Chloroflexi bacterium]|nr:redox-regulated ATPase YchF [Chloroflexota bacterium]